MISTRKEAYSTLGLTEGACTQDVRAAYRRLVAQWHPDRRPDKAAAEERLKDINLAYRTLCSEGAPVEGAPNWDFMDAFDALFRQHARGGVSRPHRIEVSWAETVVGKACSLEGFGVFQFPAGLMPDELFRIHDADGEKFVHVQAHVKGACPFARQGQDASILWPIPVNQLEAGNAIELPGLHGFLKVTLPQGAWLGADWRLSGQGWAATGRRAQGDLIIKMGVELPSESGQFPRHSEAVSLLQKWHKEVEGVAGS